jgi:hypothetical protein
MWQEELPNYIAEIDILNIRTKEGKERDPGNKRQNSQRQGLREAFIINTLRDISVKY